MNLQHTLDLRGKNVSLAELRKQWHPNITSLLLEEATLAEEAISFLSSASSLRMLDLGWQEHTAPFFRILPHLASLVALRLDGAGILDADLRFCMKLPHLLHLSVQDTPIEGEALSFLKDHPTLEGIELASTNLEGRYLSMLPLFPQLSFLNLSNNLLDEHELVFLPKMKHLRALLLNTLPLSRKTLSLLSAHPQLSILSLQDATLQDEDLAGWPPLPNLTQLSLAHNPITDKSLASLAQCKALYDLDLRDTRVTLQGLRQLHHLPLRSLFLDRDILQDGDLSAFCNFSKLEGLIFSGDALSSKERTTLQGFLPHTEITLSHDLYETNETQLHV